MLKNILTAAAFYAVCGLLSWRGKKRFTEKCGPLIAIGKIDSYPFVPRSFFRLLTTTCMLIALLVPYYLEHKALMEGVLTLPWLITMLSLAGDVKATWKKAFIYEHVIEIDHRLYEKDTLPLYAEDEEGIIRTRIRNHDVYIKLDEKPARQPRAGTAP